MKWNRKPEREKGKQGHPFSPDHLGLLRDICVTPFLPVLVIPLLPVHLPHELSGHTLLLSNNEAVLPQLPFHDDPFALLVTILAFCVRDNKPHIVRTTQVEELYWTGSYGGNLKENAPQSRMEREPKAATKGKNVDGKLTFFREYKRISLDKERQDHLAGNPIITTPPIYGIFGSG
ncbi:hypothetical protein QYF36_003565 [Acer negundo]|nr:hypothetical protein QYF36_003565 [Acer negundo]